MATIGDVATRPLKAEQHGENSPASIVFLVRPVVRPGLRDPLPGDAAGHLVHRRAAPARHQPVHGVHLPDQPRDRRCPRRDPRFALGHRRHRGAGDPARDRRGRLPRGVRRPAALVQPADRGQPAEPRRRPGHRLRHAHRRVRTRDRPAPRHRAGRRHRARTADPARSSSSRRGRRCERCRPRSGRGRSPSARRRCRPCGGRPCRRRSPASRPGRSWRSSRALGEAAPLLLLGAAVFIRFDPDGLLSGFTTLPIQIFNWAGQPQEEFQRARRRGHHRAAGPAARR